MVIVINYLVFAKHYFIIIIFQAIGAAYIIDDVKSLEVTVQSSNSGSSQFGFNSTSLVIVHLGWLIQNLF